MDESERRVARADHDDKVTDRVWVVVVGMIGMVMDLRHWSLLLLVPVFAGRPVRRIPSFVCLRE